MFNYPENTSFYSQFREDEKAFHEKYSSVDSADLFQASSYNGEFAKHGQAVRGGSNLKLKVDKTVSNLMMELHGFKGTAWVKSLCRTSRFESAIKTKQFPFISPHRTRYVRQQSHQQCRGCRNPTNRRHRHHSRVKDR